MQNTAKVEKSAINRIALSNKILIGKELDASVRKI